MKFRLSGLNGWGNCQRKVAAASFIGQIDGFEEILKPAYNQIGSAVGTACHKGIEVLQRMKLEEKNILVSSAVEQAIIEFRCEVEKHNNCIEMDDAARNKNEAEKQIELITGIYETFILPTIDPMIIEERYNMKVGEIIFTGQVDMVTQDLILDDLKTSKQESFWGPQLGGYAVLLETNKMMVNQHISRVTHIPRLKKHKNPIAAQIVYNTYDCKQIAKGYISEISKKYTHFLENENPEIFLANPSSYLCSEKYCQAHGTEFCKPSCAKSNKTINFME